MLCETLISISPHLPSTWGGGPGYHHNTHCTTLSIPDTQLAGPRQLTPLRLGAINILRSLKISSSQTDLAANTGQIFQTHIKLSQIHLNIKILLLSLISCEI